MNQTQLLIKEPKPKTGNGSKAFKTLTAAVKAAEKAAEQAKMYAELSGNSSELTLRHVKEMKQTLHNHQRFLKRCIFVTFVGLIIVQLFC